MKGTLTIAKRKIHPGYRNFKLTISKKGINVIN